MPSNDITKLLKLEGLNFETYEEKEEYIILNFSREDERPNCPRCGSTKLHINDYRVHKATDLPINNKPVKITDSDFKKFTNKRDSLIKEGLDKLYKDGKTFVINGKIIDKTFNEMTPIEVQDEIKKIKTKATKQAKDELFPVPMDIQILQDIDKSLEETLNPWQHNSA